MENERLDEFRRELEEIGTAVRIVQSERAELVLELRKLQERVTLLEKSVDGLRIVLEKLS